MEIDKFRGALTGLAVGDALGTTLEFTSPGSFEPIDDMLGGGPFQLQGGQWTDDMSMALCLAASLVERGRFDLTDQIQRYVRWWRDGYMSSTGVCFDIGNTVSDALRRFEMTGEAKSGSTDPYSAGNGSIMRLAPVPMFFAGGFEDAVAFSAESSTTTHGAPACLDACRYLGALLWGALNNYDKAALLAPHFASIDGYWKSAPLVTEIDAIAAGSYKHKNPPAIRGTGYVVQSLEAALWAFHNATTFEEGALLAANLGEDADTTAAIYGQLAGAHYGHAAIPAYWRRKIAMHDDIIAYADALFAQHE